MNTTALQAVAATGGYALELEVVRDERFALWRARRRGERGTVLIKQPRVASDPARALLEREAALSSRLSIDAVTRVLEFVRGDRDGAGCALVLEDRGCQSLATMMASGRLALGWVLDYATQIVAVLAELHRGGVLHLALRPQAVLVEGAEGRIRLTDFSEAT
jgi:serine/threonine protein kinase